MPTIVMETEQIPQDLAGMTPQPQNPGLLPWLSEQSNTLADKIVVRSMDTIPKEIMEYFWNIFGLDLIVNDFFGPDIRILEMQVFQTCLDKIGHMPISQLRKPVKIRLPQPEEIIEETEDEEGNCVIVSKGQTIKYVEYIIENTHWDELINMLQMKATTMAKRSREGFTADKLTSFKNVTGFAVQPAHERPPVRLI